MPSFTYKAVTPEGRVIENEIVAPGENEVINQLKKMSLVPVEIKQQAAKISKGKKGGKIKTKDVVLFTKQLYTLLKSGVPILVSLNAIKEQSNNTVFKNLIAGIAEEVKEGNSLSEAIAQYPKIFPLIYVNSVKIGEMSGTLEETLLYIYHFLEEENQVRQDVKKAFRYPLIVISGLVVAFLIFTTFVIPNFVPIFQNGGIDLPLPTRILIVMNKIITGYWYLLILVSGGIAVSVYLYVRTPSGKFHFHSLLLQLPILGSLLKKVSISRFAKAFHTMNRTGIPVVQAFENLQATMENMVFKREVSLIIERIKDGEGIASSLRKSPVFSTFAAEMIAIGEKSGALDDMLESVSQYYDLEVRETVNNMTTLIEPVVTVALGGMVLLFALAIFLPMWDMMKLVH